MATSLEELNSLQAAELIAEAVWSEIQGWKAFEKRVVGEQLARAADSIGANIAEAYGRFHYGDKLKFLYYSRGSLFETKYWINRAAMRELIAQDKCTDLAKQLSNLAIQINAFAQSLHQQRKLAANTIKEEPGSYEIVETEIFSLQEINTISILRSQISIQGVP